MLPPDFDSDITHYDYPLPDGRIARHPLPRRDASKLLVYDRATRQLADHSFGQLPALLEPGTLLVANNARVIAARLAFAKPTGARIEVFCLEPHAPADYSQALAATGSCQWKCLVGNQKKWKTGAVQAPDGSGGTLSATLAERLGDHCVVEFQWDGGATFGEILERAGRIPIPPYLNRESDESDAERYQTIFGAAPGSVAAPTAGLHFTPEVLDALRRAGVDRAEVTLHVGAGTFRPVSTASAAQHAMHRERFAVSAQCLAALRAHPGRVAAVGTTTVRTLESLYHLGAQLLAGTFNPADPHVDQWEPYAGGEAARPTADEALAAIEQHLRGTGRGALEASTSVMIVPGYQPKIARRLVTNFHQPRSTLLLLLASLVGDEWRRMYRHALDNGYRFLSYGDSCLIL